LSATSASKFPIKSGQIQSGTRFRAAFTQFSHLEGFSSARFLVHLSCFCGFAVVHVAVALIMQNSATQRYVDTCMYTGRQAMKSPRHCTGCNLWLQIMKRKSLHGSFNVSCSGSRLLCSVLL